MYFHSEVPMVTLLDLVHLRGVNRPRVFVLVRAGSGDNGDRYQLALEP